MPASDSEQRKQLTSLIAENYDLTGEVTLQNVAHYCFEDRGIYCIQVDQGETYLLRAFHDDVTPWLLGQAQLLTYLL